MDLLGAIHSTVGAAHDLRALVRRSRSEAPDWLVDEEAFLRHFGVPHEAFEEIVHHLGDEQLRLLEETLAVNPEAAVLWILAMREVGP
jgi:hypothetical protein